jgi:hypothetical protein
VAALTVTWLTAPGPPTLYRNGTSTVVVAHHDTEQDCRQAAFLYGVRLTEAERMEVRERYPDVVHRLRHVLMD